MIAPFKVYSKTITICKRSNDTYVVSVFLDGKPRFIYRDMDLESAEDLANTLANNDGYFQIDDIRQGMHDARRQAQKA